MFTEFCNREGYGHFHHYEMKGAGYPDFIIWREGELAIVECKAELSQLEQAIKQVKRYEDWLADKAILWHDNGNLTMYEKPAIAVDLWVVFIAPNTDFWADYRNPAREMAISTCLKAGVILEALTPKYEDPDPESYKPLPGYKPVFKKGLGYVS